MAGAYAVHKDNIPPLTHPFSFYDNAQQQTVTDATSPQPPRFLPPSTEPETKALETREAAQAAGNLNNPATEDQIFEAAFDLLFDKDNFYPKDVPQDFPPEFENFFKRNRGSISLQLIASLYQSERALQDPLYNYMYSNFDLRTETAQQIKQHEIKNKWREIGLSWIKLQPTSFQPHLFNINYETGIICLQKAVILGSIRALTHLGTLYVFGTTQANDQDQNNIDFGIALRYYEIASKGGDPLAHYYLGFLYLEGKTTGNKADLSKIDYEKAVYHLTLFVRGEILAIELIKNSLFLLGLLHEQGKIFGNTPDVDKADPQTAIKWYHMAFINGHPLARARLNHLQDSTDSETFATTEDSLSNLDITAEDLVEIRALEPIGEISEADLDALFE